MLHLIAGNAQVYLFQNYALLQRPPDNCLKALEKFSWQNFGLDVEVNNTTLSIYMNMASDSHSMYKSSICD